ncbi:hypothetical protein ACF0H5_010606 [Mactra antiquata]
MVFGLLTIPPYKTMPLNQVPREMISKLGSALLTSHAKKTKETVNMLSTPDLAGFQFTLAPTYEDICNLASYDSAYLHHVALRSGSETTALIDCPSTLFGSYNYDTCTDPTSNDTSADFCATRQQLVYNYTLCDTHQMFSQEGVLDCVYHETSGSTTYLTLYNRDSITPDAVSYFRFTCLAIQGGPSSLQLTANPERCLDNQDPTTIASPGEGFNFTSYNLCPIIIEEDTPFNWLPIIIAIVCVLLLVIIIIIIICCCCCCKRRKKEEDEEQAIDKSDTSSEHSSRKNSLHEDDIERTSLDSGISEPLPSARTEHDERILKGEGDGDAFGDKDSRPRSGERSRMSDLPPSTIPPEDDEQNNEDEERKEDIVEPIDEQQKEEDGEQKDDDDGDKEQEKDDGEVKEDDENTEQKEDENEKEMSEEQEEAEEEEKDKSEDEQEKEEDSGPADEEKQDEPPDSEHDEGKRNVVDGEDPEDEQKRREREGDDMDVSDEEERRRIGLKKGKHFTPTGALTTTLVSRDEDERKRQKQKSKTKKQKMNKLAKDKTDKDRRKGGKGGRRGRDKQGRRRGRDGRGGGDGSDDEFDSSDDEARLRGGRTAPFMQQYKHKKRIEHVLDEQHYWSDPEKDKHGFKDFDNISSKLDSDSSGSEEEIMGPDGQIIRVKKKKKRRHTDSEGDSSGSEIEMIGPDGNVIRVKKKLKHDKRGRQKSEDGDNISNADSEYMRQKMLKRAGSLDSMMSVDDRKKLNEHTMITDNEMNGESNTDDVLVDEDGNVINSDERNTVDGDPDNVNNSKTKGKSKTRTIHVKEKSSEPGADVNVKRMRKRDKIGGSGECNDDYDDIDKQSDADSGMDDDEVGDVDALLTEEQQALVVSMLFDDEMNVRPEFYRDENGCIVRRLDNTIIYDPRTGRFTFRKRLGQIFKVPRLKRNDKGRPTGGYIEDEFGPKTDKDKGRRTSSARKSRSAKSKSGRDIRSSSADVKRSRTDIKNVDFDVPDDNKDNIYGDEEGGFYKRGGNRGLSAMHRLKRRLFGKKHRGDKGVLPDVRVKRAWDDHGLRGRGGSLGPLHMRPGQKSPWMQHKGGLVFGGDPDMMQMYREGLQSDRKFLESLQGKLNSQDHLGGNRKMEGYAGPEDDTRPDLVNGDTQGHTLGHGHGHVHGHGHDQSHEQTNGYTHGHGPGHGHGQGHDQTHGLTIGHGSTGHGHDHSHGHGHGHGHGVNAEYSFFDEDGRFIIRERGCPDLKNPKVPLFTIIRRPEDMESDEQLNHETAQNRNVQSAPLAIQDFNYDPQNSDRSGRQPKYTSENSLARSDGRYSQYSYIDDNRLRRLLEELYKDKKYLDRYVETTEPKSEAVIHSKGLAEHGRDYLLERADFWEKRGPLPPRPPMTEVGWKMQRQATLAASRQASEMTLSTNETCTPDLSARHIPGVPESPHEDNSDGNSDVGGDKKNELQNNKVNESEA